MTPAAAVTMMALAPWVGAYALAGMWVGGVCRWHVTGA